MKEKFSLKDELFNPDKVHKIAKEIKAVLLLLIKKHLKQMSLNTFQN